MAEFCGLGIPSHYDKHPSEYIEYRSKKSPEQCLKEFRKMLVARPDLNGHDKDDKFIRRFLMARKYDIDESFQLFVKYVMFRRKHPEIFNRLNGLDVLIQQALRDGFPCVLPDRDRKGRCVLLFLASRWNYNCYSLINIYRSLLLSLENLIEDPVNQMRGFVVIADWTEFSFKNSLNFHLSLLKTMIEGLQDCFPARIKGVHFIGQPWYVEGFLTIIKPFLKEKSKNKIHLHGNNMSKLHEFVHPDILPPELGGEGPTLEPMIWTQKLIDIAIEDAEVSQSVSPDGKPKKKSLIRKVEPIELNHQNSIPVSDESENNELKALC